MRWALFSLACSSLCAASEIQIDGQFFHSPIEADTFGQGIRYDTRIASALFGTAAGRMASTLSYLDRIEYAAALNFQPARWISLNVRAIQRSIISIQSGHSDFFASIRLETRPFSFLGFFAEFGWFERWLHLNSSPVPMLSAISGSDRDVAARFGLHISPTASTRVTLSAGTIDDLLVYNLNNPYMEIRAALQTGTSEFFGLARYKMLLGFGRLEELSIGAGVRFELGAS